MRQLLLALALLYGALAQSSCDTTGACTKPVEDAVDSPKQKPHYTTDDLVCAVITTKKYHSTRAKAVHDTWGPRCGITLYISADEDSSLPTTVFPGLWNWFSECSLY